jgi:pimeloyl-ACP methyl ester carboxylesterase
MPFADSDGTRVWWTEQGTGAPLLLIMGLGFPASLWFRVVPDLAQRHRVITLDNRGTGRTGVPAGPYRIETMAQDALAVLDSAGVDAAHVLGISLGGLVAQELVLTAPQRVVSLTLACTHPGGTATVLPEPDVLDLLRSRADLPLEESIRATIPIAYAPTTGPAVVEQDIAARLAEPTDPTGYTHQLVGGMQYAGAMPRLGEVTVPTLCLHGTEDRLVPPANSTNLAQAISGAQLVWIEGAGHMLFSDAPERFVDEICTFTAAADAMAAR